MRTPERQSQKCATRMFCSPCAQQFLGCFWWNVVSIWDFALTLPSGAFSSCAFREKSDTHTKRGLFLLGLLCFFFCSVPWNCTNLFVFERKVVLVFGIGLRRPFHNIVTNDWTTFVLGWRGHHQQVQAQQCSCQCLFVLLVARTLNFFGLGSPKAWLVVNGLFDVRCSVRLFRVFGPCFDRRHSNPAIV